MSRKLATIRKISELLPIPNADRIELALIDGWACIVKKGEFTVGCLCVYFEVDSVLPDRPEFEFMRERKFRVKTIKLRKQISQGLALSLDTFPELKEKFSPTIGYFWGEGEDLTDLLKIRLYDDIKEEEKQYSQKNAKPLNPIVSYLMSFAWFRKIRYLLGFKRLKNFPHFLSKTDETRVQNLPNFASIYKDKEVYFSEKADGSSTSYAIYKEKGLFSFKSQFYVCSRNLSLHKENNSIWWEIARKFDIEKKLRYVGKAIAIQGEIIGPKVQDNKYELAELDFYVFNVIDLDDNYYYTIHEKQDFCNTYGFKHVPIIYTQVKIKEDMSVQDMLKHAEGYSTINPKTLREGIVIRSIKDDRQSFKAINSSFLLKYGM
jgi:hypothetical protein